MLKLFGRRPGAQVSAMGPRADDAAAPEPDAPPAEAIPLPEVVSEGNTQADWDAWEDSMTALDSQMQGLLPEASIYVRDPGPSQLDDLDPFAGVGRKRDR